MHRALVASLRLGEGGLTLPEEENLEVIAQEISDTERRAMMAERQTIDRLIATHLGRPDRCAVPWPHQRCHPRRTISSRWMRPVPMASSRFPSSVMIIISMMKCRTGLSQKHSGLMFQMGDQVDVKLVEAAPIAGALRFDMMSGRSRGFGHAAQQTKPFGFSLRSPQAAGRIRQVWPKKN